METTFNKPAIKSLKANIVCSAALQKAMKNQRKTVHLKGERIFEPWEASMNVFLDGMKLRIMYAAYGLMRGKKFSETENHYPEEDHPLNKFKNAINKCIEVHTKKVEKEELVQQFASKLKESKDLDPEFAEIVNKNFKELLY